MQTLRAIKLELVSDDRSFRALDGQSKICNWLYNYILEPFAKLETLSTCGGIKLCLDIVSSMALAIEFANIKAFSLRRHFVESSF